MLGSGLDYLFLGLLSISSLQIITHTDSTKVCAAQKNRKLSPSFLPARKKIKLMKKSRLVRIGGFHWECYRILWDLYETIHSIAVKGVDLKGNLIRPQYALVQKGTVHI